MSFLARLRASPVWPMLWKEFIQMRRDRLTLGMMVGIPAIQLLLFGYAIQTDVRHLPTVVLDESRTSESRALVDVMRNTGSFDIIGSVPDRAALDAEMHSGRARAALVIPPDFMSDLRRGRTAVAQMIVDAADPLASNSAMSGAALAGAARASAIAARRGPGGALPLEVRVRPWYNPGLRSAVYIVPGIIGVLLSITMILVTSLAIVRERERGTLEQLIVTPIDKTSLMLGKLVPFVLVGYIQMSVILLLGRLLFHVPFRGSVLALYGITLTFIVASLGLGLFISTMVRTQTQSIQLGFFLMLPNILLSGFMFPREAMPALAQWIGLVLPLTHYLTILRGIILKGVGLEELWPQVLVLAGLAVLFLTLSVRRFSKRIA
ncbi:MAG TPA: ABC transporter permease [Gemmatimonadales bacterium]|nr:ABC transporter permease [Gemmatimonadales bacterium]